MGRPTLPASAWNPAIYEQLRQLVNHAFGRRHNRIEEVPEMTAKYAVAAPTKVEFDRLVDDVQILHARMKAYRERFDDET